MIKTIASIFPATGQEVLTQRCPRKVPGYNKVTPAFWCPPPGHNENTCIGRPNRCIVSAFHRMGKPCLGTYEKDRLHLVGTSTE